MKEDIEKEIKVRSEYFKSKGYPAYTHRVVYKFLKEIASKAKEEASGWKSYGDWRRYGEKKGYVRKEEDIKEEEHKLY